MSTDTNVVILNLNTAWNILPSYINFLCFFLSMFKSIIYRLINKVETFMLMLHVLQGESLVQESRDKALKPKPSPEGAERSLTSLVYHSSPLVVASGNILLRPFFALGPRAARWLSVSLPST